MSVCQPSAARQHRRTSRRTSWQTPRQTPWQTVFISAVINRIITGWSSTVWPLSKRSAVLSSAANYQSNRFLCQASLRLASSLLSPANQSPVNSDHHVVLGHRAMGKAFVFEIFNLFWTKSFGWTLLAFNAHEFQWVSLNLYEFRWVYNLNFALTSFDDSTWISMNFAFADRFLIQKFWFSWEI